ncbi:MAG: DUF4190 domain-containing protein [Chloroflexota bacterium]
MTSQAPLNTRAALSALFAVLTALSFCVGAAPIPFTALVCYPAAILLGGVSLWTGWAGLQEIRQRGERGRRLALVGLWMGGLIVLAVLCLSALSIALLPSLFDYLRQVWEQVSVS